jgi:subtilisin family serine protease
LIHIHNQLNSPLFPISTVGCSFADVLAGFDAAVHDNVDIISVSLGSGPTYSKGTSFLDDTLTLGALHAAAKGITVVCSAGNDGPDKETVGNIAPWVTTVGASTLDRDFPSYLKLGDQTLIKVCFVIFLLFFLLTFIISALHFNM